jgi:predicted O-methyltransferase YrrM
MLSEIQLPPSASERVARAVEALDVALREAPAVDLEWLDESLADDSWALAPDALRLLAALVAELRPRHVVEFGSGASTVVLAYAAAYSGGSVISSVDHDPAYLARTAKLLQGQEGERLVSLQLAPLVARVRADELHPHYLLERAALASERPADLVLIDGPPAALGGRAGMLYQSLDLVQAGTVVLLDDAKREPERGAVARWAARLGDAVLIGRPSGYTRGLAAIVVAAPKTACLRSVGPRSAV